MCGEDPAHLCVCVCRGGGLTVQLAGAEDDLVVNGQIPGDFVAFLQSLVIVGVQSLGYKGRKMSL